MRDATRPLGSSPLARGKLGRLVTERSKEGLIPAHAGKTSSFSWLLRRSAAHPRSREENDVHAEASIRFEGSSPLTRGKLSFLVQLVLTIGLIPAHAGKTEPGCSRTSPSTAHPRSCGENVMSHAARLRRWGASPLTRGKLRAQDGSADHLGLIPAHAGKTRPSRRSYRKQPAHPRSRGENRPGLGSSIIWPGSSPLTRRKLHVLPQRRHARRLIPAHAGKTISGPFNSAPV